MGPWYLGWQGANDRRTHHSNGVQKARSLHRVPPEERFVISELKKVRGLPWNGRAENRPRSWQGLVQRLGAVAASVWDRTQKHVECDWKRHWLTRERVQVQSERESDRSHSPTTSLSNQHRRDSRSQRLHHLVLLRRCRHKTFRTTSWIHRWSWEH